MQSVFFAAFRPKVNREILKIAPSRVYPNQSNFITLITVAPFSLHQASSKDEIGWGESAVIIITLFTYDCYYLGACHPLLQNVFRERKVYHNFVLILYNFVHQVPNFVHHSFLRYRQFKFGGLKTCSPPPKCSFKIKNWIIIVYSFCIILYTKYQILYTIPSCAIGNSNLGWAGNMQHPNAVST